jgi:TRAP-type C4-dicarboxylate transport system substrate-binding protein
MICFDRIKMRLHLVLCVVWVAFILVPGGSHAGEKKQRIKLSTLAPEGSSWMKEMHRLAKAVNKETGVSFKFYPGGVSGDERDVIRKMRIGQVHAAGFTGVGLGEILPEVRVLDLPFLFQNDDQIQHVYEEMTDYFSRRFEEKGFVLLGWVPVGWIHFFSQQQIQTVADLKKAKAWMWEGDPLVEAMYRAMGIKPVPLSVTDVLLSLQTGMVDSVYASPQGALALQWFTKTRHMSGFPMGYATGGILLTKKKFDSLPEKHRDALKAISKKHLKTLVATIQKDNALSVKVINKNGMTVDPLPTEEEMARFHQAGAATRKKLTGSLFDQKLLDTVLSHLKNAP